MYVSSAGSLNWGIFNVNESNLGGSVPLNSWNHIAVCRVGTTVTGYVNGIAVGTTTGSSATVGNSGGYGIGASQAGGAKMYGYISNARFCRSAVYTSNFIPSTTPLTNISETSLLILSKNAGIYDATTQNNLRTIADLKVRTNITKYGTGSMFFDGTGDVLYTPSSKSAAFNTGDFTLEFWLYYLSGNGYVCFFNSGGTSTPYLYYGLNTGTKNPFIWSDAAILTTSTAVTNGVWQHHAITRNNGTVRIFLDGVSLNSTTWNVNLSSSGVTPLNIGGESLTPSQTWIGYMDDFRITKGYARYTANFTPPTIMAVR
jgi:hypothetical protein